MQLTFFKKCTYILKIFETTQNDPPGKGAKICRSSGLWVLMQLRLELTVELLVYYKSKLCYMKECF